jgi:DmsE family decaheme c-type cytochrome
VLEVDMRRAASTWAGIAAAFTMWIAVTVAAIDARGGKDQEGVVRPQPRAASPAQPAPPAPATPAHAALATGITGKFKATLANGQPAPGYAGDDVCLQCHEDQGSVSRTKHGRIKNPRTPMANSGCESCHGPGQAHVDDDEKGHILKFGDTKVDAKTGNETCLSCHTRGPHALWDGSAHDSRNLACSACHSVHSPKSAESQLKADTQMGLCQTCHQQQAAKMRRASHMPVVEGKMECSTCHNPHGSTNVKLLRVGNWVNESCVSCHTEKRGPFLHEHAGTRDNCTTCHDPHGSPHERMLIAKLPMLCQRCHNHSRHPATIYDQGQLNNRSNRMMSRGCVNCHANIHGSNHPAGNTLLR